MLLLVSLLLEPRLLRTQLPVFLLTVIRIYIRFFEFHIEHRYIPGAEAALSRGRSAVAFRSLKYSPWIQARHIGALRSTIRIELRHQFASARTILNPPVRLSCRYQKTFDPSLSNYRLLIPALITRQVTSLFRSDHSVAKLVRY